MQIRITKDLDRDLRKLKRKDKVLFNKVQRKLIRFENNPHHPSLRLHKLSGSLDNIWSISIDMSIRMLYIEMENRDVLFFDIGTHEDVYRK